MWLICVVRVNGTEGGGVEYVGRVQRVARQVNPRESKDKVKVS